MKFDCHVTRKFHWMPQANGGGQSPELEPCRSGWPASRALGRAALQYSVPAKAAFSLVSSLPLGSDASPKPRQLAFPVGRGLPLPPDP